MELRRPPISFPERPVTHFLQDATDAHPERVAIDYEGRPFTFRELDGSANALARALTGLGFGPGQRAAIILSNRPEVVIALQGTLVAGGAAAMPNAAWKHEELQHALGLTEPSVVIAEAAGAEIVDAVHPDAVRLCVDDPPPPGWHSFWELVHAQPGTRPPAVPVDVATTESVLIYSSGTTGLPKAVRHSHRSLVAGACTWASTAGIGEGDRFGFFLPVGSIYGLCTVLAALRAGAQITLFPRFDLETMLTHIERERVTIGFGAAPIAVAMANHPELERYDLSSLRYFIWAATPISFDVATRVSERTGIRWLHAYGTSETAVGFVNPVPFPDRWRLDSPGLPPSTLELQVVDPATGEPLPPGQEGELVYRGPQTMLGYLPEEANATAFLPGGWWRSGDIGWLEPEGWAHITDRAKEMIKVSGFSVAPVEIEKVLFQHPDIADCGVYGVPDERLGEAPVAAVVRRDGASLSEDDVKAWVADRLARYKQLRRVRFVEAVPRNPSGKVLRRLLKADDPVMSG